MVIALAREGHFASFSAQLPGEILTECWGALLAWDSLPASMSPADTPPGLALLEAIFDRHGISAVLHSGPSYLVQEALTVDSTTELVTSASPLEERNRLQPPAEANWSPGEWQELLAGDLGPWALALDGDDVVAICHSARVSGQGAEAGVRTSPEYRRRGHAAATTAAWAALVYESGRLPFYSTSADNLASQAVAARLGLLPLGWLWSLRAPE